MNRLTVSWILALSMAAVAFVVHMLRLEPVTTHSAAKFDLESLIPVRFATWQSIESRGVQIINPQLQQVLDNLYSQQLTRTYISTDGYRVMLSIAYSSDQRRGMQVHLPENCYPVQGFTVAAHTAGTIVAAKREIPVTRLEARHGARVEPITYWFTLGEHSHRSLSRFERRLAEISYTLSGTAPDGLLFRVSSIDDHRDRAYTRHEGFVADLLKSVGATAQVHLVGGPPK